MCKTKPICDEETAYPLTYQFVVYIIGTNQSECSSLLSHKRDQPISVRHFKSQLPFVALLLLTCDPRVMYLWVTCEPLVALLWPTWDLFVALLLLITVYTWNSFENCMKFFLELSEILLKFVGNLIKSYMKFSLKFREILLKIAWYSFLREILFKITWNSL